MCGDCVKRTGVKNPLKPPRPRILQNGKDRNENRDAKRAAKKLEKKIKKAALIGIDYSSPTEAEKVAAFTKAKVDFDAKFLAVKMLFPDRKVIASITLHSEGSSKPFLVECVDGSLVGGKYRNGKHGRFPIVMTETMTDGTKCWRGLLAAERRAISYGVPSELFLSENDELAEFVEENLHRNVNSLVTTGVNIKHLQFEEGNGGAHCLGPYRVGLNFIVLEEDGSLPLRGAILWENIPKGMPNKADLKPAASPRALKRKVSDNDDDGYSTE